MKKCKFDKGDYCERLSDGEVKQPCVEGPCLEFEKDGNAPLTLEELRGMDGEPVWIDDEGAIFYGLVSLSGNCFCKEAVITLSSGNFYCMDDLGDIKVYGLAYRHPPEKGE